MFIGIILLALVAPFFLAQIPPVLDYPNHLAGAYVLAFGQHDPWLSRIYAPHWRIIPDLATDLILPPLLRLLPVYVAGRLVLAAAMALPLGGLALYHRAAFGRWGYWPLAASLVAYNAVFLLGFMDFLFGVAAAFAAAAIWLRWREQYPVATILGTAAGAIIVFFCHIVALGLLATLMGGYELDRLGQHFGWACLIRRAAAAGCVFVPVVILYARSPLAHMEGPTAWLPAIAKPLLSIAPFMNYHYLIDFATACLFVVFLVVAIRKKWLLAPRATRLALLVLIVAYLVAPFRLKGGAFFDIRFVIMAGYVVFAGMQEAPTLSRRGLGIAAACLLVLFGTRMALLGQAWHEQDKDVAQVRRVVALVPPGSRVLVANVTLKDSARYWAHAPVVRRIGELFPANYHLAALLVLERHAMFQSFFADPTQQPIMVRPAYRASAAPTGAWGPPNYLWLDRAYRKPGSLIGYPYLTHWQTRFDYVLVMNAGGMVNPAGFLSDRLKLLKLTAVAALYQVRRAD